MTRPSLSTRQSLVLKVVAGRFSGHMPATLANYRVIARDLGIAEVQHVVHCLRSLRHLGMLRTEGRSMVSPDAWIVVTADAAGEQHEQAGTP